MYLLGDNFGIIFDSVYLFVLLFMSGIQILLMFPLGNPFNEFSISTIITLDWHLFSLTTSDLQLVYLIPSYSTRLTKYEYSEVKPGDLFF